ncbi:hypothetical protein CHUAL_003026 [Chamberlinius hualienensis]
MLKKSASKALIKLEPLRTVDTTRAPQRKSTNEATSPAVTSLTEVSENVLQSLDDLLKNLNSNNKHQLTAQVQKICKDLKTYGHILERKDSMQMDRYFVFLRDAAQDLHIDTVSRLRLLEIIELRASGWKGGDHLEMFYKNKIIELENMDPLAPAPSISSSSGGGGGNINNGTQALASSVSLSTNSSLSSVNNLNNGSSNILAATDVLKSTGKYGKPAKFVSLNIILYKTYHYFRHNDKQNYNYIFYLRIPSKNYYKDEIVIHNADSGKVMGIKGRRVHMIEELSGTIVSFQRVMPGAKDRVVQITGPTESSVAYAQQLIEDTIVRNTSPIRDRSNPLQTSESSSNINRKLACSADNRPSLLHSMSMNDATLGEYQYTVTVGQDLIKLAGSRLDVIRTAKLVLEEYFAGDAKRTSHELDDTFTPSEDEILSSSPSPTSLTRPPLTRSVSFSGNPSSTNWVERNGHRLTKAARITGRCITHQSKQANDEDSDDSDEEEDDDDDLCHRKFQQHRKSSLRRIVYSRDFLLQCSRSIYSKSTPKCLAKIIQENPTIIKKTAEFFDPASHCLSVGSVELVSGRFTSQTSRGDSQELDDLSEQIQ